jgi:hypothetical protein
MSCEPAVYRRKRGATWYFDLVAKSGIPSGTEVARAVLKRAKNQSSPPGDDAPVALPLSIQFVPGVAAAGPVAAQAAYWRLSAAAAATDGLAADFYITDVRIEAGGVVQYSSDLVIDARERVTGPV